MPSLQFCRMPKLWMRRRLRKTSLPREHLHTHEGHRSTGRCGWKQLASELCGTCRWRVCPAHTDSIGHRSSDVSFFVSLVIREGCALGREDHWHAETMEGRNAADSEVFTWKHVVCGTCGRGKTRRLFLVAGLVVYGILKFHRSSNFHSSSDASAETVSEAELSR